jgi:hypothetical protein
LLRLLPQSWSLEGTGALHITHTLSLSLFFSRTGITRAPIRRPW